MSDEEPDPLGVKAWLAVEPYLADGKSPDEVAASLGLDPAYVRNLVLTWRPSAALSAEAVAQAETMDLDGAVAKLKLVAGLASDADYAKMLLWVGLTHLRPLFDSLGSYDLGVAGRWGAGKSYITYYSAYLARDGVVVTDFTEASLSALLDVGKDLGFDEADELLKAHRNDLTEAILRSGQTPWARRYIMERGPATKDEPEPKWRLRPQSLAGPKVYNFMGRIRPATLSRAIVLTVDPTKDAWHVVRSFVPYRFLDPVKIWVAREAARGLAEWDVESLEGEILSEAFVKEVQDLPTEFPRGQRIGALMLLVAKVLGWDIRKAVRRAVEEQALWQDNEEVLDVAEFLAEAFTGSPLLKFGSLDGGKPEPFVNATAARNRFNDSRAKTERPMGPNDWATNCRQVGFVEGASKVKDDHGKLGPRGRWYLRIDEAVGKRLRDLVPSFTYAGAAGAAGAEIQTSLHMERDAKSGSNGSNGSNAGESGRERLEPLSTVTTDRHEPQNPDFMVGLERGIETRRTAPTKPLGDVVLDLVKELRARGREPELHWVMAGVVRGMRREGEL